MVISGSLATVFAWDIVCQNEGLGELTQVLYLAGLMAGTFVFPTLSDRFGRKLIMVFSHLIFLGIALRTAFSETYVVFVVLRFLTGFLNQGMLAGTSLSLETLPAEIRHYCMVIALMSWTTCMCLMALIAYALRNFPWKYLQMTYALFSAWSLLQWWMCDSLVYFGLYMTSSDLYGDRYLNFFLSALVEYPACLLEYMCLARIGRKWTTVIGHLIAAVGLAVATGLTYNAGSNSSMLAAATAFVLIGKLGITTAYSAVYLTTPELYPTNMRNVGFGVCSLMETTGSMIAPFSRYVWLPPCIYAVLCLTTVILFAFVPETNGVELPQTIEELTEWFRVNKFELKIGKNRYATKERQDSVTKKNEVFKSTQQYVSSNNNANNFILKFIPVISI